MEILYGGAIRAVGSISLEWCREECLVGDKQPAGEERVLEGRGRGGDGVGVGVGGLNTLAG